MEPRSKKLNLDLTKSSIQSWIWVTDLHLNLVQSGDWDLFVEQLLQWSQSGLIISGDIGESGDLIDHLHRIGRVTGNPVLFVLGNHDYYDGQIESVRRTVTEFCGQYPGFYYLNDSGPLLLSPNVAVVGHDGWADGKIGDYWSSPIKLTDFVRIHDFLSLDPQQRLEKLRELGEAAAVSIEEDLLLVPETVIDVLIVTHIPPFREACWYMGRTTDDLWAPFFTCDSVGRVIDRYAVQNTQKRLWVLCGHTHHGGLASLRPNLHVLTGGIDLGRPGICSTFSIDCIKELFQADSGERPA